MATDLTDGFSILRHLKIVAREETSFLEVRMFFPDILADFLLCFFHDVTEENTSADVGFSGLKQIPIISRQSGR